MLNLALYMVIGLVAGIASGLVGIGGGIIVVPCLVLICGFSQHLAQGTTLAMLIPPIGILAVLAYYRQGQVNIPVAAFLCLGFILGGLIGGKIAVNLPEDVLRKVFGFCLMAVAGYMIFK